MDYNIFAQDISVALKEGLYYNKKDGSAECLLCPHNCIVPAGKRGICGSREGRDGKLYTAIYGEVSSAAMDPIEKKPLYHFYPGSKIFSIGTKGCNLKCPFCQNWSISQERDTHSKYYGPEEIVKAAVSGDSIGIAYTYSEPVIWFEYVKDTSLLAKKNGLKNVLVTNGYINQAPLEEMLEFIDAMNIDLKCHNSDTYSKKLKGGLGSVKDTIRTAYNKGCFIEITTLIVPKINDNINELMEIADFIASIDKRIPWHLSRYYPSYKYNEASTDIDFIAKVWESASRILDYVFTGNIHSGDAKTDTLCPKCHTVIINRKGYATTIKNLDNGSCIKCGHELSIIH